MADDSCGGTQKNIHVHDGVSEDAFVAMRNARDKTLDMPVLILPSVQINMRATRGERRELFEDSSEPVVTIANR
jgi:hypothetical protein